jgi:hypothetical protein
MMAQIAMILCSLVPFLLYACGIVHALHLSLVAFFASVFLFLGTFIIGDRRARVELQRRFHIR